MGAFVLHACASCGAAPEEFKSGGHRSRFWVRCRKPECHAELSVVANTDTDACVAWNRAQLPLRTPAVTGSARDLTVDDLDPRQKLRLRVMLFGADMRNAGELVEIFTDEEIGTLYRDGLRDLASLAPGLPDEAPSDADFLRAALALLPNLSRASNLRAALGKDA